MLHVNTQTNEYYATLKQKEISPIRNIWVNLEGITRGGGAKTTGFHFCEDPRLQIHRS